jgi:hypothetical protein
MVVASKAVTSSASALPVNPVTRVDFQLARSFAKLKRAFSIAITACLQCLSEVARALARGFGRAEARM